MCGRRFCNTKQWTVVCFTAPSFHVTGRSDNFLPLNIEAFWNDGILFDDADLRYSTTKISFVSQDSDEHLQLRRPAKGCAVDWIEFKRYATAPQASVQLSTACITGASYLGRRRKTAHSYITASLPSVSSRQHSISQLFGYQNARVTAL